eukprot:scaffold754_cov55-Attheya_sp.AAC.3
MGCFGSLVVESKSKHAPSGDDSDAARLKHAISPLQHLQSGKKCESTRMSPKRPLEIVSLYFLIGLQ